MYKKFCVNYSFNPQDGYKVSILQRESLSMHMIESNTYL